MKFKKQPLYIMLGALAVVLASAFFQELTQEKDGFAEGNGAQIVFDSRAAFSRDLSEEIKLPEGFALVRENAADMLSDEALSAYLPAAGYEPMERMVYAKGEAPAWKTEGTVCLTEQLSGSKDETDGSGAQAGAYTARVTAANAEETGLSERAQRAETERESGVATLSDLDAGGAEVRTERIYVYSAERVLMAQARDLTAEKGLGQPRIYLGQPGESIRTTGNQAGADGQADYAVFPYYYELATPYDSYIHCLAMIHNEGADAAVIEILAPGFGCIARFRETGGALTEAELLRAR